MLKLYNLVTLMVPQFIDVGVLSSVPSDAEPHDVVEDNLHLSFFEQPIFV